MTLYCKLILYSLLLLIAHSNVSQAKCYTPNIIVGEKQLIGTLAPISISEIKNNKQADTAIILIPGLNSVNLSKELYEWRNYWDNWNKYKNNSLDKTKYNHFVFRYNGWDSIYNSSDTLAQSLQEVLDTHSNIKELILVGYSQGGIIARIIDGKYSSLSKKISKIITLASPHHGSLVTTQPFADDILQAGGLKKLRYKIIKDASKKRYKHVFKEQAWDNFDGTVPKSVNYQVPAETLKLHMPTDFNKYIVYGSYITPKYPQNYEQGLHFIFRELIPRNFFRSYAGQLELNKRSVYRLYPDETEAFRETVRLNDGIIQLASAIWLTECTDQPNNKFLKNIFTKSNYCKNAKEIRVFKRLTHLQWRRPPSYKLQDLANPDKPSKTLYDWLIQDISASSTND